MRPMGVVAVLDFSPNLFACSGSAIRLVDLCGLVAYGSRVDDRSEEGLGCCLDGGVVGEIPTGDTNGCWGISDCLHRCEVLLSVTEFSYHFFNC